MDENKIDEIRNLQNFLGGYSNVVLDQFKLLPYLVFRDISSYKLDITDEEITVTLISYTGIKGWFLRKWYKSKDVPRAKLLTSYIRFWAPKGKASPKVIIKWQTS